MERHTGPDPSEDSTERFDATLHVTLNIRINLVTSNAYADEDQDKALDTLTDAIEALGHEVHVKSLTLEPR